jgi:DNA polymerase III delta prime subunit
MSSYFQSGNILNILPPNVDLHHKLPVGTYTVGFDQQKGYFLKTIDNFCTNGKIYGNTLNQASRILNTFGVRENSTGVLLNGEKGSGKTLLAKVISQYALKENISTIVINTPFHGDEFNAFIQSINEPCIIIFDEFEKVFDDVAQQETLTLLDGVFPTKKLFILTVNDKYLVNSHLKNRPGRIFYMIDFSGLDVNFIKEYCVDNLNNKSFTDKICKISTIFPAFNFDMLKAMVEEMNRYNETPEQVLQLLNIKPTDSGNDNYKIKLSINGREINSLRYHPTKIEFNPLSAEEIQFDLYETEDRELVDQGSFILTHDHIRQINTNAGVYVYNVKQQNNTIDVTITKNVTSTSFNWVNLF